jgi:hypothetical protein
LLFSSNQAKGVGLNKFLVIYLTQFKLNKSNATSKLCLSSSILN